MSSNDPNLGGLPVVGLALARVGELFYDRNWVLGTGGNFSAILRRNPFRLAITASGVHKGSLGPDDFVVVDENGAAVEGMGKPSAETSVHLLIAQLRGANSILHTHSVWATFLSDVYGDQSGIEIQGYEMLKGLAGVSTHEHREWLPILENSQDYLLLGQQIRKTLEAHPEIHGLLLRRHGLYTWGKDIFEAQRHVEIFEFLLEVLGKRYAISGSRSE